MRFLLAVALLAGDLVAPLWLLSGCTDRAPPMEGRCEEIVPQGYVGGEAVGATLRCLWRGRTWDCTRRATGMWSHYWDCVDRGPAPAEAR